MNTEIKRMIQNAQLYQWEVAKALGITAGTFTIWLRDDPLPEARRIRITDAIRQLVSQRNGKGG